MQQVSSCILQQEKAYQMSLAFLAFFLKKEKVKIHNSGCPINMNILNMLVLPSVMHR